MVIVRTDNTDTTDCRRTGMVIYKRAPYVSGLIESVH